MGPKAVALVAEVIDRLEARPRGTGRPPMLTLKVVEALRFFVREGVQWRELRAATGRAAARPCAVAWANGTARPSCAKCTSP